jgi:predicted alpha/beta-fold hydrolase
MDAGGGAGAGGASLRRAPSSAAALPILPSPPDAEDGAPGEAEQPSAPPPPPRMTTTPQFSHLIEPRARPPTAAEAAAAGGWQRPDADAEDNPTPPTSTHRREDVPKLFYNPSGVAAQVLATAAAAGGASGGSNPTPPPNPTNPTSTLLSPFSPPPWLRSPHAQSAAAMARVVVARRLGDYGERQVVMTADGGTLALDWWQPRAPEPSQRRLPALAGGGGGGGGGGGAAAANNAPPLRRQWLSDNAPVALLIHGINGGSFEGYVRSACAELASRGVRPVVLNLRGCGGQELTSGRGYTALQAPDVAVAVSSVAARHPRAPLLGVGFSLGAVLLAKYVAEADMGLHDIGAVGGGGGGGGGAAAAGAAATKAAAAAGAAAAPLSAPPPPLRRPATASGSGFVAVALVSSPVCLHAINARMASPLSHPMPFVYNLLVAAKLRGYWRKHEQAFASSGLIPADPPPPEARGAAPPSPARATPSLVALSAAKAAASMQAGGGGKASGGGGGGGAPATASSSSSRLGGAGGSASGGVAGAGAAAAAAAPLLAGGGGRASGGGGSGLLSGAPLAVLSRERARPVNAGLSPSLSRPRRQRQGPSLPPRRQDDDRRPSAPAPAAANPPPPTQNPGIVAAPRHLRDVGLTTAGFDGELMRQLGFQDRAGYYRHACTTNYVPFVRTPALLLLARDDPFLGTVPARLCAASPWTVLALTRRGGHLGWAHGLAGQRCWSDGAVADWLMAGLALWRRQPAGSGWVECAAEAARGAGGGGGVVGVGTTGGYGAESLALALRAPRTPRERDAASRALADAECTCLAQQELRRRQRQEARRLMLRSRL